MRTPVIAGTAGGVGTTTLAAALHAHDAGRSIGPHVDVLVCRGTADSLRRAEELLRTLDDLCPVLAVTADSLGIHRRLQGRLQTVQQLAASVVVLPPVTRWRTLADPIAEAASLLGQPPEMLPRALRGYADALRALAAAVIASGRLTTDPESERAAAPAATNRHPSHGGLRARPHRAEPIRVVKPQLGVPSTSARHTRHRDSPAGSVRPMPIRVAPKPQLVPVRVAPLTAPRPIRIGFAGASVEPLAALPRRTTMHVTPRDPNQKLASRS